jgi:hypothetical protein
LSQILGFLKLLYEHKEKIILGALVVVFVGVGAFQWKEIKGEGSDGKGGSNAGGPVDPKPKTKPRPPTKYPIPQFGNQSSLNTYLEITDPGIFVPPKQEGESKSGEPTEKKWAQIKVKSIFDATKSGSFIAIIEVDRKRMFVKEGEQFGEYSVDRIDGVRNCMTIGRRGSKSGEGKREFCEEN